MARSDSSSGKVSKAVCDRSSGSKNNYRRDIECR